MTKLLPSTFQQCFGHFNMLTVHKCSDTGLFRHLNNHVFCSLAFRKEFSHEVRPFLIKCSKLDVDVRIGEKKKKNILCFGDNCIRIGSVKYLLLWRENTCHHESTINQTVSMLQILLRKNFLN